VSAKNLLDTDDDERVVRGLTLTGNPRGGDIVLRRRDGTKRSAVSVGRETALDD
jgi:hypothetical protein